MLKILRNCLKKCKSSFLKKKSQAVLQIKKED